MAGRFVAWRRYIRGVAYDYPYLLTYIHITESARGDIHSRLICGKWVPSEDDEAFIVFWDEDAEQNGRRPCAICFGMSVEEAEDYDG